jgi:hypothetical protein
MPTIDPIISNYIDVAIERERKIFVDHMKIEREIIQDDIRKVIEIVQDKPSRTEVSETIHENLSDHERRIRRLETKVF